MNIEFSPFDASHIMCCAELYCQTYRAEPWNEVWGSNQPIIEFLSAHLDNNYFRGYVAKADQSIVAACIGFKKPWNQGVEYYIDEFFLHPDFQRKNIGSQFMQYIEQQCHLDELNAIILNTERDFPSELFYKKNGFKQHEGLIILSKTLIK